MRHLAFTKSFYTTKIPFSPPWRVVNSTRQCSQTLCSSRQSRSSSNLYHEAPFWSCAEPIQASYMKGWCCLYPCRWHYASLPEMCGFSSKTTRETFYRSWRTWSHLWKSMFWLSIGQIILSFIASFRIRRLEDFSGPSVVLRPTGTFLHGVHQILTTEFDNVNLVRL